MIWRARVEIYFPKGGEPYYRGDGESMMSFNSSADDGYFIDLGHGDRAKWFYVEVDEDEL